MDREVPLFKEERLGCVLKEGMDASEYFGEQRLFALVNVVYGIIRNELNGIGVNPQYRHRRGFDAFRSRGDDLLLYKGMGELASDFLRVRLGEKLHLNFDFILTRESSPYASGILNGLEAIARVGLNPLTDSIEEAVREFNVNDKYSLFLTGISANLSTLNLRGLERKELRIGLESVVLSVDLVFDVVDES